MKVFKILLSIPILLFLYAYIVPSWTSIVIPTEKELIGKYICSYRKSESYIELMSNHYFKYYRMVDGKITDFDEGIWELDTANHKDILSLPRPMIEFKPNHQEMMGGARIIHTSKFNKNIKFEDDMGEEMGYFYEKM